MLDKLNTIPQFYRSIYEVDEVKNTFTQYKLTKCNKQLLSEIVRIETNNGFNNIKDVDLLLKVRDFKNWKYCTFTGLRRVKGLNYFYADLPINLKKSLIVGSLSPGAEKIYLIILPEWYPNNRKERVRVVNILIDKMKKEGV